MQAGASALSVLTDEKYFGGSMADLRTARKFNYCPILRKDFIVDEYQIHEAKSIGADAILLIASILDRGQIKAYGQLARELGMEVLLEIHAQDELERISDIPELIGVNNRDLTTFTVDYAHSLNMFSHLPVDSVKISESGISDVETIKTLRTAGYDGFLIGEHFMQSSNPGTACGRMIKEL